MALIIIARLTVRAWDFGAGTGMCRLRMARSVMMRIVLMRMLARMIVRIIFAGMGYRTSS